MDGSRIAIVGCRHAESDREAHPLIGDQHPVAYMDLGDGACSDALGGRAPVGQCL